MKYTKENTPNQFYGQGGLNISKIYVNNILTGCHFNISKIVDVMTGCHNKWFTSSLQILARFL